MVDKKISLNNVYYTINEKTILNNINICINEGERIAICGPNGAGKSTLINIILNIPGIGFNPKKYKISGNIENTLFSTRDYKQVKVHLQNSMISYNFYLKVNELLTLCFGKNLPMEWIEKLGLTNKLNNKVITLSGGELQKLNLMLVIASNPKVIFLDEMTTGLDYEAKKQIIAYLKEYLSQSRSTLIFVTHYLEEITELVSKIIFINEGTIVEQGDLNKMFHKYNITNNDICMLYEEVIMNERHN